MLDPQRSPPLCPKPAWLALLTLALAGCGGAAPPAPPAAAATASDPSMASPAEPDGADPTPEVREPERPTPRPPSVGRGDASRPARPATAVRFEVIAFEPSEAAARRTPVIPETPTSGAQFWPGNSGDVLERKLSDVTQYLGGDAISSAWNLGDPAAFARADQIALRVVKVETKPAEAAKPADTGRFAARAVEASGLPTDGRWFRIRFFPGGVWKDAQVQGYLQLTNSARWYRVDGLPRGLYGPQSRDYQPGDLFEFKAVDRPSGKLYPFE